LRPKSGLVKSYQSPIVSRARKILKERPSQHSFGVVRICQEDDVRGLLLVIGLVLPYTVFSLSSCATQEEMKPSATPVAKAPETKAPVAEAKVPSEKAPEVKAKPIKAKGDVGLLDLEKNYMIVVTKEGKLITVDFTDKTKVTKINPTPSKMEDIGLGSSATVEYQAKDDKKIVTKIEYKAAKGGE
jgi:hypothetical protein